MGMGTAAMAGMVGGAAAAYGTSGHAEESTDFEGMSETIAADDDMDSLEDEPFAETEVESFEDDTEVDDEVEGDDDEGYFLSSKFNLRVHIDPATRGVFLWPQTYKGQSMKTLILLLSILTLAACSSPAPSNEAPTPVKSDAPVRAEKPTARKEVQAAGKPFTPAKPMKCKFDTDCVVQDSCVSEKCKLSGKECRFRSDCPSPRGTCISDKCEFH
jgi:hypothetical protein